MHCIYLAGIIAFTVNVPVNPTHLHCLGHCIVLCLPSNKHPGAISGNLIFSLHVWVNILEGDLTDCELVCCD